MTDSITMFDALHWTQQVATIADGTVTMELMRHAVNSSEAAIRMTLSTRENLPENIRQPLKKDPNPWVRTAAENRCVEIEGSVKQPTFSETETT